MNEFPDIKQILINTFSKLIEQSSTFISNLISAALILTIGWAVARIAAFLFRSFFSKVGVDKLGEKIQNMEMLKKYQLDFKLSEVLSRIVFILIMLFLSVSAADTLGVPAISNMFMMLVDFIPKLGVAIMMTLLGLFVSDLARKFVETLCKSFNIASGKLISMGVFFFLSFISVILALGQAGINTKLLESSFNILVAGLVLAFSIGYGIASKEILLNILSSIYSRKKFSEGDLVEILGVKGTIIRIDNTTLVLNADGNEVSFPLRVLQTEKITLFHQNQ
ncbi:MAG: mechanosensitive ion channel [Leadbetterella sp.]|nr:mechanosensitive ion channel [Leadbetterella sp.]